MDSTPPVKTRSSQPDATFCAPMFTASRPEAQKRLSWTPATVSGRPALIAAVLAMSAPWSPTGETQPSTTSSTRFGSSLPLRASISCMRPTTRSTGFVECSEPFTLPFPRGVRSASKTRASVLDMRLELLGIGQCVRRSLLRAGRVQCGPQRPRDARREAFVAGAVVDRDVDGDDALGPPGDELRGHLGVELGRELARRLPAAQPLAQDAGEVVDLVAPVLRDLLV